LPFVTLLTKYYDRILLDLNYYGERKDSKEKILDKENQRLDKSLANDTNNHHYNRINDKDSDKINYNGDRRGKTITVVNNNNTHNAKENNVKDKDIDEEMMQEIVKQIDVPDIIKGKKFEEITQEEWDQIYTPEARESIRKVKEILDE
jgi:hypothetical protein